MVGEKRLKKSPPQHMADDEIAAANAQAAAARLDIPVIIKDVYRSESGGATFVEVRMDGIHLRNENQEIETFFPLNGGGEEITSLTPIETEIRCQIAKKLSLLVPNLSPEKHTAILEYTVNVLDTFAQDQEARVRRIIAHELKSSTNAPKEVIDRLARDVDITVAGPILEFSPLLNEHELLDIIASSPVPGVLEAIARRRSVSQRVSEAIVRSEDAHATRTLLENHSAEMPESLLEFVVSNAPAQEAWHRPLLMRPEIPLRTVNRIASFVSRSLIMELQEKNLLPENISKDITLSINTRFKNLRIDRHKEAEYQVSELAAQGRLDADQVSDALETGEHEFVVHALATLAALPVDIINRILSTRNPKAITSLVWKAGLPMRLAIRTQLTLGKVLPTAILYARDGVHFPLEEAEMQEYLRHFTG